MEPLEKVRRVVSSEKTKLAQMFHEYFDIGLASTPEDLAKTYRVRYRVYCDEFEFLPKEENPDELETDEYDAFSHTCLIVHRRSAMPAACVRVVPAVDASGAAYPLPYELLGREVLDNEFHDALEVPRPKLVEISRLAVDGAFRRRQGEKETRFGEIEALSIDSAERRTFGLLSVAAFLASSAVMDAKNYVGAFAMMEPFLPRLMNRSGINFKKVGQDIDYHGIRAPYYVLLADALTSMHPDLRDFYQSIYECIE